MNGKSSKLSTHTTNQTICSASIVAEPRPLTAELTAEQLDQVAGGANALLKVARFTGGGTVSKPDVEDEFEVFPLGYYDHGEGTCNPY